MVATVVVVDSTGVDVSTGSTVVSTTSSSSLPHDSHNGGPIGGGGPSFPMYPSQPKSVQIFSRVIPSQDSVISSTISLCLLTKRLYLAHTSSESFTGVASVEGSIISPDRRFLNFESSTTSSIRVSSRIISLTATSTISVSSSTFDSCS